jgi:hypothetical protein
VRYMIMIPIDRQYSSWSNIFHEMPLLPTSDGYELPNYDASLKNRFAGLSRPKCSRSVEPV